MGTNGGKREGAGRKPGSRDRFNKELHEQLKGHKTKDPALVLVRIMESNAGKDEPLCLQAAKALIPHVYPKLVAQKIDANLNEGMPLTLVIEREKE